MFVLQSVALLLVTVKRRVAGKTVRILVSDWLVRLIYESGSAKGAEDFALKRGRNDEVGPESSYYIKSLVGCLCGSVDTECRELETWRTCRSW